MHFIYDIFFREFDNFIINLNFRNINHYSKIRIKYYICFNLFHNLVLYAL